MRIAFKMEKFATYSSKIRGLTQPYVESLLVFMADTTYFKKLLQISYSGGGD